MIFTFATMLMLARPCGARSRSKVCPYGPGAQAHLPVEADVLDESPAESTKEPDAKSAAIGRRGTKSTATVKPAAKKLVDKPILSSADADVSSIPAKPKQKPDVVPSTRTLRPGKPRT